MEQQSEATTARGAADDVERRVHVDLPRVAPEDMVTTHDVTDPQDPDGGRDTDRDFMLRNAGVL